MKIDESTVAVITGAASGIGRALALCLIDEGASIAIADINQTGLSETAQMISARHHEPNKVSIHVVDVSNQESLANFVTEVVAAHGSANLLINNAGVALAGTIEELSIEDIEWLMAINFWGVVYGVKHFLPLLRRQNSAHIVNISSVFGLIAPPGHSAYVASKFAVRGFTETLKHELSGSTIRVSVVHPGGVKTNIVRDARCGAGANISTLAEEIRRFEKATPTTPSQAAERIVRGILHNEERILIGYDARIIDLIQRWLPVRYWRLFEPLLMKMTQ